MLKDLNQLRDSAVPGPGPAPVIGRPYPGEALGPIPPLHHPSKRAISRTCAEPVPGDDESLVSMRCSAHRFWYGDWSTRAIIFQDGDWWVCQGLELDIAAQARSKEALVDEMNRIMEAHVRIAKALDLEPFQHTGPAPIVFWHLYDQAEAR